MRKATELDKTDYLAYVYLVNALWETKDLCGAEINFSTAVTLTTEDALPFWCLAYFYEQQNKNLKAEKLYKKALRISPNDPEAKTRYEKFLSKNKLNKKAKI